MAIDRSAAEAATSSLQSLPFGNIIGGPLVACVEAQAQAARTSWEFIQNVGLYADGEEKKTVNVSFQFIKDGRMAQITVCLLYTSVFFWRDRSFPLCWGHQTGPTMS